MSKNIDKLIDHIIGFEDWVMDNYNKYHKPKVAYPNNFKSENEEEILSDQDLEQNENN